MNSKPQKVVVAEVDYVNSYMFEDVETREVLHLDRMEYASPWVRDIVLAIEKLSLAIPEVANMWISEDFISMKLAGDWKVRIRRDGTVIIKVPDCALVADDKFLLLCMDKDGRYVPVAKGEEITWDGTEEYFTPSDIRRLVKETFKRVLERTHWL
jgi:hypothetical protein